MTSNDVLYIVIPAYNEEMNIEAVAREWHEVVAGIGPESRLVIINDGSKDHTYDKLVELSKDLPQLLPVTKPNGGHGATVLFGYHYCVDHHADYIFQTDSDGQTLPSEFPPFWAQRTRRDYRKQESSTGWVLSRLRNQGIETRSSCHFWIEGQRCQYSISIDVERNTCAVSAENSEGL